MFDFFKPKRSAVSAKERLQLVLIHDRTDLTPAELDALKGAVPTRVTLFACDSALAPGAPWVFEPWDELRLPASLVGGGGTRFTPVFDWVARQDRQPDLLVYFTDAKGEFPEREPAYPVLWLVKGKTKIPWGQRIQLN